MGRTVPVTHKIITYFLRLCFSLRYRVVITGEELLKEQSVKLFLPNHQALIEPVILISYIFKYSRISPVITAKYYKKSFFKPVLNLVNAIPVSDLESGERDRNVYNKLTSKVMLELSKGHHVLFYPSGQLSDQAGEQIHNKQGAYRIVSELQEDIKVIGVRISGFWGSIWSKAGTGKTPDFGNTLLKALGILAINFFFFAPKRKVKFEFVDLTQKLKELALNDRKTFNSYLEEFYTK